MASDVGLYLTEIEGALSDEFFNQQQGPSKSARDTWAKNLKLSLQELERFCRALRFRATPPLPDTLNC